MTSSIQLLAAAVLIVFCAVAATTDAKLLGAPEGSCDNLLPIHGAFSAKKSAAPYTLSVEKRQSGDAYELKISGHKRASDTIKGFIVQARNKAGKVVGQFVVEPSDKLAQHLRCKSSDQGTVTHRHITNTNLSEIKLLWKPTGVANVEDVHFRATIVKKFDEFWVGLTKPLLSKNSSPLTL